MLILRRLVRSTTVTNTAWLIGSFKRANVRNSVSRMLKSCLRRHNWQFLTFRSDACGLKTKIGVGLGDAGGPTGEQPVLLHAWVPHDAELIYVKKLPVIFPKSPPAAPCPSPNRRTVRRFCFQ